MAITWGIEHFRIYLLGAKFFSVISDHKPLEVIFNKLKNNIPARIERWILRLQQYNFKVQYQKGSNNPADYLSRSPSKIQDTKLENIADEYIHSLLLNYGPKHVSL